jgi:hypothetical protein
VSVAPAARFVFRTPWDNDPALTPVVPQPDHLPRSKRRGRRPAAVADRTKSAPAWLYHHLTITGPCAEVAAFAEAARGPGVIPWHVDYGQLEEDIFHRAVAARGALSIEGCHRLARQFCQRIEAHDAKAVSLIGRSLACPFDLQVLLPIPNEILRRGPTDPTSLAWLAQHWGTRDPLRKIVNRENPSAGRRLPVGHAVISFGFFTTGDTPHAAIASVGARWSTLRFALTPRPAD